MQARRVLGFAAVFARGVCAGTIESSSGSARDAPMPRSNVRRDRCFFVMNMLFLSSPQLMAVPCIRWRRLRIFHPSHLEWRTLHHSQNKRRKTIVAVRCFPLDAANERHVAIVDDAAQSIGQQVFGERSE